MKSKIFSIASPEDFEKIALDIFAAQSKECAPYRQYISLIGVDAGSVESVNQIPFLPVSLFKTHRIITGDTEPRIVFTSSATTGTTPSKHPVVDLSVYEQSFLSCFNLFWGNPRDYAILALLPSYLEREGSSLVYMADSLIKLSQNEHSGFYLNDFELLFNKLSFLKKSGCKTLLLGVSFALLDFVTQYKVDFPSLIVMETGGMKGRNREIGREELHWALKTGFGVSNIASEYGMAELLSQAYSYKDGIFETPPWMRVVIRDLINPFEQLNEYNRLGGINIIDLANLNSCSFIQTEDMGIMHTAGKFSITGRIKNSELRGCNLLLE